MSQPPAKRNASPPLLHESRKKSKRGLTDTDIDNLNEYMQEWVEQFSGERWGVEDDVVQTQRLPSACRELSVGNPTILAEAWTVLKQAKEKIASLSPEDRNNLASVLIEARDSGTWEHFANSPTLQPEVPEADLTKETMYGRPGVDQTEATEKSWGQPFKGNAAVGLWSHIQAHYNPQDRRMYAHYTSIVQSSGMGKSRTVDELAKDHFVIPLNLRKEDSTGYPPADHCVREYLASAGSKNSAYDRACVFLEALFMHTANVVSEPPRSDESLAKQFRTLMTEGQKMGQHNTFRTTFYEKVIEIAKDLVNNQKGTAMSRSSSDPSNRIPERNETFPPYLAFQTLTRFFLSQPAVAPLVVLAFDEAHTITERYWAAGQEWTVFNELRYALRRLHHASLFTLFLSTTGKISQFTSTAENNLSKRVVEGKLTIIQPYTDLGFDPLAERIAVDGSWNLDRFTTLSHICSQGRPLFGTRYRQGSNSVKEDIILFAAAKLLNGHYNTTDLSDSQRLACLSQRLPIEFCSTNYIAQEEERGQVEGHMRVCLKIDATFQTMTTMSSSEPILSDAAYFIMQKGLFGPEALKSVMEGFSISKGDRGEFLVLYLLILARDMAVGPANDFGRPKQGKCWFTLPAFLYKIFRRPMDPSKLMNKKSIRAFDALQKDFPNAYLHFSHFIKVHEFKAIDIISLLLLLGRGAAVLCATNQSGIDAVNVFLKEGPQVTRENAGLVLHQMKNDAKYSSTPVRKLFKAMDPYDLGILEEGTPAVPLIKIVFALASKVPSLNIVRRNPTKKYHAIVYEIWCAGISPEILGPVEEGKVGIWDALLQASYGWKELYNTGNPVTADLRRSEAPGAARNTGHYFCWS